MNRVRSRQIAWDEIRLAVFDVDGTLYDQRRLRTHMMIAILRHVLGSRQVGFLKVLREYRRGREELGDEEVQDFEPVLLERTAKVLGCSQEFVAATVLEWINTRPLPYLRRCMYPGVSPLFAALRRRGIAIGVLSDYPAAAKLAALDLYADYVVSAADPDVGVLKPNPRGLLMLLERASVPPVAALMIGDRVERDGFAASRANVPVLIRSSRPVAGWLCFSDYHDPLFQDVLNG